MRSLGKKKLRKKGAEMRHLPKVSRHLLIFEVSKLHAHTP